MTSIFFLVRLWTLTGKKTKAKTDGRTGIPSDLLYSACLLRHNQRENLSKHWANYLQRYTLIINWEKPIKTTCKKRPAQIMNFNVAWIMHAIKARRNGVRSTTTSTSSCTVSRMNSYPLYGHFHRLQVVISYAWMILSVTCWGGASWKCVFSYSPTKGGGGKGGGG